MLLALLLLAAAPVTSPDRGSAERLPQDIAEERLEPRLHLQVGAIGQVNWLSGVDLAGGPGLRLEVGLTLFDRVSVGLQGSLATTLVTTSIQFGAAADLALSPVVSLGLGAGFAVWPLGSFVTVPTLALPVRLGIAPFGRNERAIARSGLLLLLSAGPAINPTPRPYYEYSYPEPGSVGVTAELAIAWARW